MTIITIARLTIRETQRRRLLWIGALMSAGFLLIFGLGFHFIYLDITRSTSGDDALFPVIFLTLAGLYATNLMVIMVAILISVTTISGEIETHTIESLLTKPIGRWQLIVGKWLGYTAMILLFVLFLPGGVLLIVYLRSGFTLDNIALGLAIIYLGGLIGLGVSIVGGTRLSTLANGALAFMLFGIAFIGGWVEQIGAMFQNETAVDVGIIASLFFPTEIIWKKASTLFLPDVAGGFQVAGPFLVISQPSNLMILYSLVYIVGLLGLAMLLFSRRDL